MPALQETRTSVTLAPAKPTGLADLGVLPADGLAVKKGRVHEFPQLLADGSIGRRFQDLKVIAIRTEEAGAPLVRLVVQFEVFGDNTAAAEAGPGFEAVLKASDTPLATFTSGSMFLPFGNFWYANRFAFAVPVADFDAADTLEFVAKAEEVRAI